MSAEIQFRVSVVGLFVDGDQVLLLHQVTPPEPDCWDLPGGGLELGETLLAGLTREIREETGLSQFQVERLLTVVESDCHIQCCLYLYITPTTARSMLICFE